MKTRTALALITGCLIALTGCDYEARISEPGFRLPEGDVDAGRTTFLRLQCHGCHTIAGEELPPIEGAAAPYIELGGQVAKVKTYGELVTSIINPSHKLTNRYAEEVVSEDGVSKMPVYNDHMTIQELIDVVTFLQSKYNIHVPAYHYRVYPPT